jgi:hypothetical protein
MAATVCPAPQFVGLDNSGNPLSGGKLYSYSAGTTTNLNTFSDSDLSVANGEFLQVQTDLVRRRRHLHPRQCD